MTGMLVHNEAPTQPGKKRLRVLTNSELTTRKRCDHEHHVKYELGYRSVGTIEALRFGTLIHAGLEELWLGRGIDAALARIRASAADAFEDAKACVLIIGYVAKWSDDLFDQVVAVEAEFRAPLVNPETGRPSRTCQLGGKIDVLLRDGFVEHKTTSESDIGPGSEYWRDLRMNAQVSTYFEGAAALGVDPRRCVFDVIRKPQLRPSNVPVLDDEGLKVVLDANGERVKIKSGKKWRETGDAEAGYVLQTRPETPGEFADRLLATVSANPDLYYQRHDIVRLEGELYDARRNAWRNANMIAENLRAKWWARNEQSCRRYKRPCDYREGCEANRAEMEVLNDPTRFVRVENVHSELAADTQATE